MNSDQTKAAERLANLAMEMHVALADMNAAQMKVNARAINFHQQEKLHGRPDHTIALGYMQELRNASDTLIRAGSLMRRMADVGEPLFTELKEQDK